jgi:hypothetical protein
MFERAMKETGEHKRPETSRGAGPREDLPRAASKVRGSGGVR